jgi:hypothetical protein
MSTVGLRGPLTVRQRQPTAKTDPAGEVKPLSLKTFRRGELYRASPRYEFGNVVPATRKNIGASACLISHKNIGLPVHERNSTVEAELRPNRRSSMRSVNVIALFVSPGKQPSVSIECRPYILLRAAKQISFSTRDAALLSDAKVLNGRAWARDVGPCHQQTPARSQGQVDFNAFRAQRMTEIGVLGLRIDVVERIVTRPVVFGACGLHDGPRHAIQQICDLRHDPKPVSQRSLWIRNYLVAANIARTGIEPFNFFGREVPVGHCLAKS